MIIPVILCGGSGSRLWPLSREHYPKPLLQLIDEQSLLQNTLARVSGPLFADPVVITQSEYRFLIAEQCQQTHAGNAQIILEPCIRDTAAAACIAALYVQQQNPEAIILLLPADHYLPDTDAFIDMVAKAESLAVDGHLVTFGIKPTSANTAYGYIHRGAAINDVAYQVDQFTEKPDETTAKQFLADGNYDWNSGMFLCKAKQLIAEFKQYATPILTACKAAIKSSVNDLDFIRLTDDTYQQSPKQSFDYAIMEHTQRAAVVPIDVDWSDIGTWSALWETLEKDAEQNVIRGDVLTHNVTHSHIQAEHRLVTAVGVQNCLIVETADAVLVADKNSSDQVKHIAKQLATQQRYEALRHRKVYRPWGWYETMDEGHNFKVKRLCLKPKASLSLQLHCHRSEHWVVVQGNANVQCNDKQFTLTENQSTYIPANSKHRLTNPGTDELHVIEVQSGHYLGEDDIMRFADQYGRIHAET